MNAAKYFASRSLLLAAFAISMLALDACAINDYQREQIADQLVSRYLRDGGAAKVEERKVKIEEVLVDVEAYLSPGITGDLFNTGLELIGDQLEANPEDVRLGKFILGYFMTSEPDLSLPVSDEHLRIVGVYIVAIRKSAAEFEADG